MERSIVRASTQTKSLGLFLELWCFSVCCRCLLHFLLPQNCLYLHFCLTCDPSSSSCEPSPEPADHILLLPSSSLAVLPPIASSPGEPGGALAGEDGEVISRTLKYT